MSEQLFEVAFSGQIREGVNAQEVKARVGKLFNADDAKIAQLFSGKRIIIKKNLDQATAVKYQTALNRAGAECEVVPMGGAAAAGSASPPAAKSAAVAAKPKPAAAATPPAAAKASATAASPAYDTQDHGDVAPPPQTDPLGITGDQIEDLSATIAPVGSEMQDAYADVEEPQIDIDGLDIAPVGADLSDGTKEPDPPPPDTSGIAMAD